jgi:enamine deaminase RidA (YjgF/YER057c/UK114 family)
MELSREVSAEVSVDENGASDLFVQALGPNKGTHARSAIGVASLPKGFAVKIEVIIEAI